MAAFPLSILALAAGVYLLIKVKREALGRLYMVLSWLVIVLSLLFMLGAGVRAWHHSMGCGPTKGCHMEQGKNGHGHGNCGDYNMNGKDGNCEGSCGGACDKSCGDRCGMKDHEKDACCMAPADSTAACGAKKGSCCMDKMKEETPKPAAK